MRVVLCLAAWALVGPTLAVPQPRADTPPEAIGLSRAGLAKVTPLLQAYVDSGKIAGAVGVVARRGRIGYFEAVGQMDVERRTPLRTDHVFRIFSMTKPIVAAGVLRLVDRGILRLSDPVAKYLPSFGGVRVFTGGSSLAPTLAPPTRPITMADLLTHTAGLTYGFFGNTPVDSMYNRVTASGAKIATTAFADSIATLPLLFSPGTRWTYSLSIDVLGAVIERASGQSLDRFLAAELFEPLGMTETSFHRRPSMQGRIPTLYLAQPGGLTPTTEMDEQYEPAGLFLSGGGGLLSTPADYLRFAQMLLNGGELNGRRVLRRGSVALMMRNQLPASLTPIADPIVGHEGYGHGLGGVVLVDSAKSGLPGSPGIYRWWGYAGTFFWIDPKAELVAMVWTQLVPGRAYPLEHDFQHAVYAALTR